MDINQNINAQKTAIDLSHFARPQNLSGKGATEPREVDSETSTDTPVTASTVNLSKEGRAASVSLDFNATTDNLTKIDALGDSEYFPKAHAAISYEKIKNLLG